MAKIENLLAVLESLTEEGRIRRLYDLGYTDYFAVRHCGRDGTTYECNHGSLADLAFKLRDEALTQNKTMWQRAMDIVFLKASEEHWKEEHQFVRWPAVMFWLSHKALPIHWIIAALIAKELEKENG